MRIVHLQSALVIIRLPATNPTVEVGSKVAQKSLFTRFETFLEHFHSTCKVKIILIWLYLLGLSFLSINHQSILRQNIWRQRIWRQRLLV